jgi:serine-type D-Ala-D-Ala carboxypeptidase
MAMAPLLRNGDPQEAGVSADRIARVRRLCADWVVDGVAPALVVLAARHGVVVLHEAYGTLGPEHRAPPLTLDAVFPLASITKAMTAAAVMSLVDDGLLGLNRPVQEYVPEFTGEGKEQVMVYHLLTHTSGLADEDVRAFLARLRDAGELREPDVPPHPLLDVALPEMRYFGAALAAPLSGRLNAEMSYSNYGMALLGEIAARVGGAPLPRVLDQRVFRPLGMGSATFDPPPDRTVRRWPDAKSGHMLTIRPAPPALLAVAGACATAWDTALFFQMLLDGGGRGQTRVLSRAAVAAMVRNQVPGIPAQYGDEYFPEATWGLGIGVRGNKKALRDASLPSPAAFSHGGAGGVFAWADPATDVVGAYFSVCPEYYPTMMEKWNADLFANAVSAAVAT